MVSIPKMVCFFEVAFDNGLRFPLHPFIKGVLQRMTEEAVKLKSDLKHTTSACAQAEGREDEARNSLRAAEGELREVRDELQATQNDLLEARDGLQSAQYELQMVRDELLTS